MGVWSIIFDVICLGGGIVCLCLYLYRVRKSGRLSFNAIRRRHAKKESGGHMKK